MDPKVTCDVYLQLWDGVGRFDPTRGSPLQWIMVIARNRAIDYCRRRIQRKPAYLMISDHQHSSHDPPAAEDAVHQFQIGTQVHAALSGLSTVQARVIGLAFFEGLSHREIACCTQLPLGTVKSHICRALTALRKHLSAPDLAATSLHVPFAEQLRASIQIDGNGIVGADAGYQPVTVS